MHAVRLYGPSLETIHVFLFVVDSSAFVIIVCRVVCESLHLFIASR